MFFGVQEILIFNHVEKVYRCAESYPTFVRFFKKQSRILHQNEHSIEVEVHSNLAGLLPTQWRGRGIKLRNTSIEFTQTEGLFKGLKALWLFEPSNERTKVSIKTSFALPKYINWLESFLGKTIVEGTTRKILQELKCYAEKKNEGVNS